MIVGQLRRDLRDMLALVAGAVELVGARPARTVAFCHLYTGKSDW